MVAFRALWASLEVFCPRHNGAVAVWFAISAADVAGFAREGKSDDVAAVACRCWVGTAACHLPGNVPEGRCRDPQERGGAD